MITFKQYLHRAFLKDPTLGEEHHGLLVELYAEYEPKHLLPFLRMSNNYSLEKALDICQQRSLIHEVVFLLGKQTCMVYFIVLNIILEPNFIF